MPAKLRRAGACYTIHQLLILQAGTALPPTGFVAYELAVTYSAHPKVSLTLTTSPFFIPNLLSLTYPVMATAQPDVAEVHASAPLANTAQDLAFATSSSSQIYSPSLWRPPYLRRRVILPFLVIFSILAAVPEALLTASNRHGGLAESQQSLHYAWKYGPTALLTLILSIWGRVEYQAKVCAPWWAMSRPGRDPLAVQTVLLDYLSMVPPLPVLKALTNGHWIVALTSGISLAMRINVIISTGLLTLIPTNAVMESAPIMLRSHFISSINDSSVPILRDISDYTMAGIANHNISYPPGVFNGFVYQNFTVSYPQGYKTATATVDGLSVGLTDCSSETLKTGNFNWTLTLHPGFLPANQILSHIPSASGIGDWLEASWHGDPRCDFPLDFSQAIPPNETIIGASPPSNWTTTAPYYAGRHGVYECWNNYETHWRVITFAFRSRWLSTSNTSSPPPYWALDDFSFVACRLEYAVQKLDVTITSSGVQNISVSANSTPWTIPGVLPEYIYTGSRRKKDLSLVPPLEIQPLAQLLGNESQPAPSDNWFLDTGNLMAIAKAYTAQLGALNGHMFLMKGSEEPGIAKVTFTRQRLMVINRAAHAMTAIFLGCFVMSAALLAVVPSKTFMPRMDGSILRNSELLAESQELFSILKGAGAADSKTIRGRLGRQRLHTEVREMADPEKDIVEHTFKVCLAPGNSLHGNSLRSSIKMDAALPATEPKHPLPLNPISRGLIIAVLISVLILLEVTLQSSNRNMGLADVTNDQHTELIWTTVPALVLSLIATILEAVDFQMRVLTPYSLLSRDRGAPVNVTRLNLLDRSLIPLLYEVVYSQLWAPLVTTIVSLIAPFFTIASASLFVPDTRNFTHAVQLATVGSFNRTDLMALDTGHIETELVLEGNMSYPDFTYQNLAFPELKLAQYDHDSWVGTDTDMAGTSTQAFPLHATIPAFRAHMNCTLIPPPQLNTSINKDWYIFEVNVTMTNEEGCHQAIYPTLGTTHYENLTLAFVLYSSASEAGGDETNAVGTDKSGNYYFGLATPAYGTLVYPARYKHIFPERGSENSCARNTLFYIWGRHDNSSNIETTRSLSIARCTESAEVVDVDVQFLYTPGGDNSTGNQTQSLVIDTGNPPNPVESSARAVQHDTSPFVYEPFQPATSATSQGLYEMGPGSTDKFHMDKFFLALLASSSAITVDHLGDRSAAQEVMDAIVAQHGILRAGDLAASRRVPAALTNITSPNPGPDIARDNDAQVQYGGKVLTSRRRLVQDEPSTRVLQVLLGVVAGLSSLAWCLMPRTKIMPRDTTSIASLAALLADGDLVEKLPKGAVWMDDKQIGEYMGNTRWRMGWKAVDDGVDDGSVSEEGQALFPGTGDTDSTEAGAQSGHENETSADGGSRAGKRFAIWLVGTTAENKIAH